jgi:hypothetical protein
MAEDLMRYDLMAQEALRGVVKAALRRAARQGLPGDHHFFVAFDTTHSGVRISERLRKKYPDEMTIVLQHQFWSLEVYDDRFEVDLSFDNIPERLSIPFSAIKGFFDPSVQFGLQFDVSDTDPNEEADEPATADASPESQAAVPAERSASISALPQPATRKPAARDAGELDRPVEPEPAKVPAASVPEDDEPDPGAAKVVKLDTFRKK